MSDTNSNPASDPATATSRGGAARGVPLAERMRPRTLDEFHGQQHLVGDGKFLRVLLERDDFPSLIFWGPPGTGKTTLATIIAGTTRSRFIPFSAVTSGIQPLKEICVRAEKELKF